MMCVNFGRFTGFTVHDSCIMTFFPLTLTFFNSVVIKSFYDYSRDGVGTYTLYTTIHVS